MSTITLNALDPAILASETFARVFRSYLECSEACQAVIRDMISIYHDQTAADEDRNMALDTIADALFPLRTGDLLGVDLEVAERLGARKSPEIKAAVAELDGQESYFADRVKSLMEERGLSQVALAQACEIGQPAVSMLLSRRTRPQRRTVEKVAKALGVEVGELWPTSKPNSESAGSATAFDVLNQAGLVGCLDGSPDTPADLSTNPAPMEGFGRDQGDCR